MTAVNTVVLLLSALTIFLFNKKFSPENVSNKKNIFLPLTILLGSLFLIIQGNEWVKLINFGLTTSSGIYGAFFYTIIGIHGVHVLAGLILLFYLLWLVRQKELSEKEQTRVTVCSMYWYFVVIVWPFLYVMVYLY